MPESFSSAAVVGAGSWGTALAVVLAEAGLPVTLWCNEPAQAELMRAGRSNPEFLPGVALAATPLDAHYTMARVHWHLRFEKTSGAPQDFRFHITYFLFDPDSGTGPKVAFYISHEDEQKVMREAGLLPADEKS